MLHPYPTLWQVEGFRLTSHGFFFAVGAEAAGLLLLVRAKRQALNIALVWPLVLTCFFSGLVGARFLFVLLYPEASGGWSHVLYIWQGGLVSYGGLIFGLLAGYLYIQAKAPENRAAWYDAAALATLLGWGIGRIGNFLAGDSTGTSSSYWSLTYGDIPIQLFESGLCFVVLTLLRNRRLPPGRVALLSASGYFLGRFFIDTWRNEAVYLSLHASQWVSLFFLIILCVYARFRH